VNKTIDPNMYSAVEVTWIIAGDKDRAATNNANQIEFAKTTIPNIDTVLTSPLQYYVTANTVVTTDINGLDS
jgi:phosphopantothenoylcysteine synthetase/decarboxylase